MKENKTTAKQRLYGIARYLCAGLFINVACLCFQVSFYFPAVPVIVALVAVVLGLMSPRRPAGRFKTLVCFFALVHLAIVGLWLHFILGYFGIMMNARFAAMVKDADRIVIRDGGGLCHSKLDMEPSLYEITNKTVQFGHNDDDSKDAATRVDRQVPLGEADGQGIYPAVEPIEAMRISSQELSATYRDSFYPYDSGATYKGFLKYYIKQIRQKGAYPILVTSAVRLTFHGKVICPEPGHHGGKGRYHDFPYVEAVRQLGREEQVPVLDLFAASKKMQEMLGPEDATYMQSIKDAQGNTIGEVNYNRPEKWPEEYNRRRAERDFGSVDNTHQNRIGSFVFAALLIELMHEQHILEDKLRQVPTKQVPIPEKLLPRKKDIAAMFHYVKLF